MRTHALKQEQLRGPFVSSPARPTNATPEVSRAGDAHERAADGMADAVMRAPAWQAGLGAGRRPACACGGGCPSCQTGGTGGRPLPGAVREFFEPRFGYDFRSVRIHTDARAASSARSLNALAYTKGADIVFGAGAFRPEHSEGKRLLAHELSHVVQQSEEPSLRGTIQRQPAPQTPGEPSPLSMRAPVRLELANPFTDAQANASMYELGAWGLGFGLEKLGQKYPTLNRSWVLRLAEMTAGGLLLTTGMTYSHEMGHYREARRFGWGADIDLNAPWSGVTHYDYKLPPGQDPPAEQELATATAGVNQQQLNAGQIYSRWALNRDTRYQEAAAYFLAQTNLFFYSARTAYLTTQGTPPSKDDLYKYVTMVPGWSLGEVIAAGALSNLFSAPALSAIGNSIAYLWTGRRRVRMPSFKAFGAEVAAPHFQMFLTTKGVTLGGRTVVDFGGGWRAEFTVDALMKAPDDPSGLAVGAKLHDLPAVSKLTPKLHVSPFVRGTVADSAGYYVGADVTYDLLPHVGISAKIGYRDNDLLSEPEGRPGEGVEGGAAVTGRF